ncbi:MAG: CDP-alcohol phosphatidyltransferase family protein [Candidatus Anstonellaceae archaeon]
MLKSKFAAHFQKVADRLSWIPFSPNQLTMLSIGLALIGFALAFFGIFLASLAFFAASAFMDALDGALARARKQTSAKGAYLDGIADRIVEFLLVASFFFFDLSSFLIPMPLVLFSILFFGSTMTAFTTAYAHHRKVADEKKIQNQPRLLERAERVLLLLFAFALAFVFPQLSSFLLLLTLTFSFFTFLLRTVYFYA